MQLNVKINKKPLLKKKDAMQLDANHIINFDSSDDENTNRNPYNSI
jgi:hypothetical protein